MYDAGETVTAISRESYVSPEGSLTNGYASSSFQNELVGCPSLRRQLGLPPTCWLGGGTQECPSSAREGTIQDHIGWYSRLAAFVAKWRQKTAIKRAPAAAVTSPLDPRTGAVISPIVAAALCIKPCDMLTRRQAGKVDILRRELPIFACMRSLAMRFRGFLRGHDSAALDT